MTNKIARNHKPDKEEQKAFISSMNSYLGIMKHYRTYKLRKVMIFKNLSAWWWNYIYLSGGVAKFVVKTKTSSHKVKHIPLLHHTSNPQREELALLHPHNETTVHIET